MFTCPITQAVVAPNHPYPLPYGSTQNLRCDYSGQVIHPSALIGVFRATIPERPRPTTLEEKQAQEDTYRAIINDLMVNYLTDPRTTPELPIAHIRTVILVEDVETQRGSFAREGYTMVSDPTIIHAIDAFTYDNLGLPRAMMAKWAELYSDRNTPTADDVLTPTYREYIKEGWVTDPTMVTYGVLDWDLLPEEAFSLYGYSIRGEDMRAIAQAAQAAPTPVCQP